MNGVRRFLGGSATGTAPAGIENLAPIIHSSGPSWPPASPDSTNSSSPPSSTPPTPALFLRKKDSAPSPRMQPSRLVTRKSVHPAEGGSDSWKRSSGMLNTKDELLISLLASEAVVDSREFQILTSEQVDDLKKEHQVLSSRLGAMTKKLSLETKIRDAAVSLSKVNASNKKVSKKTEEQLDAANKRVDSAQRELWRVSDRANDVHRKLLEHRAGVLSFSVRSIEKKMAPSSAADDGDDSGYNTPNNPLRSPTASSVASGSASSAAVTPRFDGAHLFAGHADAVVPKRRRSPSFADAEISALQHQLKAATSALAAASKKQAQMTRDLSVLQLEKQEVETMMGMELQNAEETITALEHELPRLEELDTELQNLLVEKGEWERDRVEREGELRMLHRRLDEQGESQRGDVAGTELLLAEANNDYRRQLEAKEREIQQLKDRWEQDRVNWDRDKLMLENERVTDEAAFEDARREDRLAVQRANDELEEGLREMQEVVQRHGVLVFPATTRDSSSSSLVGLVRAVGTHVEGLEGRVRGYVQAEGEWEVLRRKLEEDVRSGLDKREAMARDIEDARREREEARREARTLEDRVKSRESDISVLRSPITRSPPTLPRQSTSSETGDATAARYLSLLQPIWAILPSPDTRAAKLTNDTTTKRPFRAGSPVPSAGGGHTSSLSELDVRSLKTLYDTTRNTTTATNAGGAAFSIEAFALRVHALIADDRALIERLVRFAQAHDLLKKNAERAQKLAAEGNVALETYQRQVRVLEERNMSMGARHAAMQDQVQQLQDAIERISAEKRDVEMLAAEQAETCRQLTDANNTLSARTLTLAEEAVAVPERIKRELEGQLAETRAALGKAQDEVDAMRMSEQSQRIALLDELNSMQTENGTLRQQLRAFKK